MVVQHNITAMNANRMLGVTTNGQSKSTEKLSSGYRINRAADDAAGLSISEKMRKQIRGLSQASTNAQDGISCVQTAEGALTEVHSMLQRMNELTVQSANGTNSSVDRDAIQAEIDQLTTEIDRVSETTKFNDTYLLKGDDTKNTSSTTSSATFAIKTGKEFKESYTLGTGKTYWAVDAQGTVNPLTDATTAEELAKYVDKDGKAKDGYKIYNVQPDATNEYGKLNTATDILTADLVQSSTGLMDSAGKEVKAEDLANYFDAKTGVYKGGLYSRLTADNADGANGTKGTITQIGAEQINKFVDVTVTEKTTTGALSLNLHVGADSTDNNKIKLEIESMSSKSLGVDGLKVDTEDGATNAINTIEAAIQKVSDQRSKLGAVQNRLEHTVANLDNVVENTTSAESRIRDTDMAEEMVIFSIL